MTTYPFVELLAPAGNEQALHAAVSAGADAVYLGLDAFNARRGADNFTLSSLKEACAYAHARGVKVYVTMNTIIFPNEMDRALEYVRQAYRAGADAFIVQDLGLAAEISRTLPQTALHLSTQMNTHSLAGVRAAAELGAERITLARELSLAEVELLATAAAEMGMQVETFAHGALCVCYSGQCFMSSMIGGRSANRGMCAQACRLPYELRNAAIRKHLPSPGDHLLSPQDLCTVEMLDELVDAGVSSLKIEGRMKSPEYVAAVVAVYRKQLDKVLQARAEAAEQAAPQVAQAPSEADLNRLTEAFSRGFTTAYLTGERGNSMMSYQRPNNRGLFLGRVDDVQNGVALLKSDTRLAAGDVLEFWTRKGNCTATLNALKVGKGGRVEIPLEGKARGVRKGDRVFRVRSAQAQFADSDLNPRIPVVGVARLSLGEPLQMTFQVADPAAVDAWLADHASEVSSDEAACLQAIARRYEQRFGAELPLAAAEGPEVELARTKAVTAEDVAAHVDRLGGTPYRLVQLSVNLDEGVGVGFSLVHKVRAAALDNLSDVLAATEGERRLPRVADRVWQPEVHPAGSRIGVIVTNPACARAAKRAGAHLIYVPALNYARGEAVIAGQLNAGAEQAGYPKQAIVALPVADHDPVGSAREAVVDTDVWKYVHEGKPVLVESLGALERAVEEGALPDVGMHLPLVNRLALDETARMGAQRAWLSPELTLHQIQELAKDAPLEIGVQIIGATELMVTEHCLLMSQGPCDQQCATCPRRKSPHYLKDRKGYEFPVITDLFGRSHLYNSVDLDVVPALPDLMAAGVSAFLVDATLMNVEQTAQAVGRAIRALHVAQNDGNSIAKMPDVTSGHLYRGVS